MSDQIGTRGEEFWSGVKNERALQQYRTLVSMVDGGVYQLDADGRFLAVNDPFVEMTGYAHEDLLGEHISLVVDDRDCDRLEALVCDLAGSDRTERVETIECSVRTADGTLVDYETRLTPVPEMAGGDRGVSGILRPTETTPRGAEKPTQSSFDHPLSNLFDETDAVGVVVLDSDFEIVWIDETAERYFGLEREDVIGRDQRELIGETIQHIVADEETFAEAVMATYDDNSHAKHFEYHISPGDGREERWLEHWSTPIESGTYAGGRMELYYDITDRKKSEQVLERNEKRFRSLVQAVEEYAIYMLDPDGCIVTWNTGAEQIKGYEREDILGEHFSTFYTREDVDADVPETNLEHAAMRGFIEDEGWRLRADGSAFWANVMITAIRDDDGVLQGYAKVTRDMTDRRERDQLLRREQLLERYQQYTDDILDAIDDVFYVLDEDGTLKRWNESLCEATGYRDEEIASMNALEFFDEDDTSTIAESIERCFETGAGQAEANFLTKSGEYVPYEFAASTLEDPKGNPVLVGIGRDVTERNQREQELERKERRYEAVFEDPNILVGLLDPDGTVLDVNQTAMDYIDTDIERVIGEPFWETPWWGSGDGAQEDVREWTRRAAAGEYVEFETDLTRPDGRPYILSGFFRPVTDADGEVVSIIVSDRDITERKKREQQLEESNERLEQFAYAASHDLQEPLRMVSSYLQLIDRRYADELDENGRDFLEFAVDGAERMSEMIDGLLEYSRVETQGDPFEPVDLNAVFDDVLTDLEFRIEKHDAKISSEDLPRIRGDASQLRQVFQNLIDNAIEYSGDEPPLIYVSAERDGTEWVVTVRDQGIGIDADEADRIFEVFQRLHTQEEYDGTGIGLALCQRIVERHGGDIWVDSEPDEGTRVSFTLPATGENDG